MRRIVRAVALATLLAMAGNLQAETFSANFTSGIPSTFRFESDAKPIMAEAYRRVPAADVSWFWGRVGLSNAAALCPTHNADGTRRASAMWLSALDIEAGAVLVWDARSMHRPCPEAYEVLVKADGVDSQVILHIAGEDYAWTTRGLSLDAYAGKSIEIGFSTAVEAPAGFMLAIDNINVGAPTDSRYVGCVTSPAFSSASEPVSIEGYVDNFGATPDWRCLELVGADNQMIASAEIASLPAFGERMDFTFALDAAPGDVLDYKVRAVRTDGTWDVLATGRKVVSYYARTLFMDRFTGTWCNNCPLEAVAVADYEATYGTQLIVAEAHVGNDPLVEQQYWADYGSDFIFSVPQLIVNHNRDCVNSKTGYQSAIAAETIAPTIADIACRAERSGNAINARAEVRFAEDTDNKTDRYAVGYLLLADVYDPSNALLIQCNQGATASWREYYYMPDYILPQFCQYRRVVVEGSTGVNGVDGSLSADIQANNVMESAYALDVPATYADCQLTLVALVIDRLDGRVLNAAAVTNEELDSVALTTFDATHDAGTCYDLQGRPVDLSSAAPGFYISYRHKILKTK